VSVAAEVVYLAHGCDQLSRADESRLKQLLNSGPAESTGPVGTLHVVIPRPGTISPWSSKATETSPELRLERGAHREGRGVLRRILGRVLENRICLGICMTG